MFQRDTIERKWFVFLLTATIFPFFLGLLAYGFWLAEPIDKTVSYIMVGGIFLMMFWLVPELFSLLHVVTAEGIAIRTLRGRTFVPWGEMTSYRIFPPGLIILTKKKRYVISLTFYKNPRQVIRYFEESEIRYFGE